MSMRIQQRQERRLVAKAQSPDREVCPRCGRPTARVIGRSEAYPAVYLRCDECGQTSVARAC